MISVYAKSLRDEYIATAADYGLDNQMTKMLLRDYRALSDNSAVLRRVTA